MFFLHYVHLESSTWKGELLSAIRSSNNLLPILVNVDKQIKEYLQEEGEGFHSVEQDQVSILGLQQDEDWVSDMNFCAARGDIPLFIHTDNTDLTTKYIKTLQALYEGSNSQDIWLTEVFNLIKGKGVKSVTFIFEGGSTGNMNILSATEFQYGVGGSTPTLL